MKKLRSKSSALLCAGIVFAIFAQSDLAQASSVLRARGRFFVNDRGQVVLLRGVNLSGRAKVAPLFLPLLSASADSAANAVIDLSKLDPLPSWGINVVRLLFIWEEYEPRPGEFNESYLEKLGQIVDAAWKLGIYTVIDFHQDVFSRYVGAGCGAGFPEWTVPPDYRTSPQTSANCGPLWSAKTAITRSLYGTFKAFYRNTNGVRSAYLRVLGRIARFFSSHAGAMGYDLLNEPIGSEKQDIYPLYLDGAQAVRNEDPSAILFLSPQIITVAGLQSRLPRPRLANIVYSPHFYDIVANAKQIWSPKVSKYITTHAHENMRAKAEEWGVPLFIGEFGAFPATSHVRQFMDFQYETMDAELASGTQWSYTPEWNETDKDGWNLEDLSIVDSHGALRDNFRPRPSFAEVSGIPSSQKSTVDASGRIVSFEAEWQHFPKRGGTRIFVPGELLRSAKISTEPQAELDCRIDLQKTSIFCSSNERGLKKVRVTFSR